MVSLAKIILGDPTDKQNQGVFTFIEQLITPIYVVGYSCPHSPTRREAIRLLLSTRRREGLWDTFIVGKIMEWIMDIEEEFIKGEYVPEDTRTAKVTLKYNLIERTAHPTGLMPIKGSKDRRTVEADLTWREVILHDSVSKR